MPLETASPEHVSEERSATLRTEATDHFCLEADEHDVLVALAPNWVPVLSEAMLGEALEADADGAPDLMQEMASQGFGTVQSTLAAEGLELPGIQFTASGPGETPAALDGSSWHVSFSAQHDGGTLEGFVLVPASEETPADDAASSSEDTAASPAASPSDEASASSPTAPSSEGASASPGGSGSSPAQEGAAQPGTAADQESGVDVAPAAFSDLGEENIEGNGEGNDFGLLAEVDLEVRVELGRRELPLADVLKLTTGSVVELEKMVGEPLSVYANGRLIAEGEAVVIDEQFGVRITNLASESSRDKAFF